MPEDLLDDNTALGMLRSDHQRIEDLLATCLTSKQVDFTRQATRSLLQELEIHTAIEQEIFLPAIRKLISERRALLGRSPEDSFQQARKDNSEIGGLTERLKSQDPAKDEYYATLKELAARFERHCFLEEEYIFLAVEMNDEDTHNALLQLSRQMKKRRDAMLASMHKTPADVIASRQAKIETYESLAAGEPSTEGGEEGTHGA